MEKDSALFVVQHASKLSAGQVAIKLEDHRNTPITVVSGKAQRGVINRKRGIGARTLFDGALGFWSTTNLTKTHDTSSRNCI